MFGTRRDLESHIEECMRYRQHTERALEAIKAEAVAERKVSSDRHDENIERFMALERKLSYAALAVMLSMLGFFFSHLNWKALLGG